MNEQDKLKLITKKLMEAGLNEEMIKTFMLNNYEYLMNNLEEIKDNIYFLFNSNDLYGIVIAKEDKYLWSNVDDNEIGRLQDSSEDNLGDYIIEDILRFGENGKFKNIYPNLSSNYLENIKILKKIKFNSNGYYIK